MLGCDNLYSLVLEYFQPEAEISCINARKSGGTAPKPQTVHWGPLRRLGASHLRELDSVGLGQGLGACISHKFLR